MPDEDGKRAARMAEEDRAANASGPTEDQIFALVVRAAAGRSTRMWEAGRTALAEAIAETRPDHAT